MKIILILSALLFSFLSPDSLLGTEKVKDKLKIGMELSYPPFETIDPQGKPYGISVALAYALGDYLNLPVSIENIPFIGLIPSLKTGKIDLIISSLTVTPERSKALDFSDPYIETGLSLLVSNTSTLTSIEEANNYGRTIVVKQGTTGEVYAKKHMSKAKLLILDKESSCVLEVVQHKADAFIYDQFSVFIHWQKNLTTTHALLRPFYKEFWAVGVKKGNEELLHKVNAFLVEFKKRGGFDKLGDQYLPELKAAFEKLGIPFFL